MNRFLLALKANNRDEITWYTRYRGDSVKCYWRKNNSRTITFAMFRHGEGFKTCLHVETVFLDDKYCVFLKDKYGINLSA